MNETQKAAVLRSVDLFKHLPDEVILPIAEKTKEVTVAKGQTIFREGEEGNGLYMIVSGDVQIIKQNKVISELSENDFFGELALIDSAPRAASAIAIAQSALLFLDKDSFLQVANTLPDVFRATMKAVMRYLRTYTT